MELFWQIGIIGLVEEEWIATLATIDPEDLTFLDFVEEGTKLAKELKENVCTKYFDHVTLENFTEKYFMHKFSEDALIKLKANLKSIKKSFF